MASKADPVYTVVLVVGGMKYDLTKVLIRIDIKEPQKQLAQIATIYLYNTLVDGRWLSTICDVRHRLFIFADDGEKKDEVFRGVVWTKGYQSSGFEREIALRCYDNTIYLQESEVSEYFSEGQSSQSVLSALLWKWGVQLDYRYESITHEKLALRGAIADIMTDDILEKVKEQTGKKYLIRSTKDTMTIMGYGENAEVYTIDSAVNATQTKSEATMEGMVTQVVILGKDPDNEDREPIEATVSGDTGEYGTLQQIINREEEKSLADAQKEAQKIIDEKGKPKRTYDVRSVNIPWIRKGDKVHVAAGDIDYKDLLVMEINRTISIKENTMSMVLEAP